MRSRKEARNPKDEIRKASASWAHRAVQGATAGGPVGAVDAGTPPAFQMADFSFPISPLAGAFFKPDARQVALELLGHWLVRRTPEGMVAGLIVETEAYLYDDPASHAFRGPTPRNRAMFGPAGRAYVYFIYGNHWCFNAVCQPEGVGEAVLIRAIEPSVGAERMALRRPGRSLLELTNGPAKLCEALSIDRELDGADLTSSDSPVFLAENPERALALAERGPILTTRRIGIRLAADLPLRFHLERSPWVSRR